MAEKELWRHHFQELIGHKFSGLTKLVDDSKRTFCGLSSKKKLPIFSCLNDGNPYPTNQGELKKVVIDFLEHILRTGRSKTTTFVGRLAPPVIPATGTQPVDQG